MKFECNKCGNSSIFYHEVTVVAKERVKSNGVISDGPIFDKSNKIDASFDIVYCSKCNNAVGELEEDL